MFCLCFESPFIFWGRCGVGTVWENMFRVATAVACALYQFIFLHETCLRLLLCCFIFLLFTLVWFVCECVCEPVSGTEQCDQIMRWWGFKPQSVTDQSLYSATSCLVYWNLLCFEVLCYVFLVPESSCQWFFTTYAADIMSLRYWLFFIKYWLDSPFSKLTYFDWYELAINRQAIHLLNSSYLILFLLSDTIAFLNSLIFSI